MENLSPDIRLSPEFVRGQFPAFNEPSLRDRAYFDNSGGTYACRYVIWRLHRAYRERLVEPHGVFPASERAGEEMDEARRRLSLILGVRPDEVSFGPSTAQNTYVLAQAFAAILGPGEAVVVTGQDDTPVAAPWRRLAERGIEVREWPVDPDTGALELDALTRLLEDGRVRLVCFPHAAPLLGHINDAARICRAVHRAGAYACIDGIAFAPHGLPNVGRSGADIYLFSGARAYGPHQGVMVVRRALAERLPDQVSEPGRRDSAGEGVTSWVRFTPAGPDPAQIAACAGMADYVDALYHYHTKAGRDVAGRAAAVAGAMRAREAALMEPLVDFLADRPDLGLLGPRGVRGRMPTFALDLGRPAEPVARRIADRGIMVATGAARTDRALAGMRRTEPGHILRFSLVHYTSEAEVDRLIEALDAEA